MSRIGDKVVTQDNSVDVDQGASLVAESRDGRKVEVRGNIGGSGSSITVISGADKATMDAMIQQALGLGRK